MKLSDPYDAFDKLEKATIVVDTSSICALYNLQDKYKQTMIKIFQTMKDRLWLPSTVWEEYMDNRVKAIMNPVQERYGDVDFVKKGGLLRPLKDYIEQHNSKEYYHPFMDDDKYREIKALYDNMVVDYRKIQGIIKAQQEKRRNEIKAIVENDVIMNFLRTLKHGKEISYDKMLTIAREGDFRYRNLIPPGYQDSERYTDNKKVQGKTGIRQYNDLIIWKEILEYAKLNNTSVVFISNDMKNDWYELKSKEPISPRYELIREFHDYTKDNCSF